jgi:TolB protein
MVKAKRLGKGTTLGFITLMLCGFLSAAAQDRIKIELNMGQERPRLAAPDFKAANGDPQTAPLNTVFNQTLWNDLDNAGIFDMVAKSFYPSQQPGQPAELQAKAWGDPPPNAGVLTFGNVGVNSGKIDVQGWLYDVKNPGAPQILGKQYKEDATPDMARVIAHRFADEIIARLGSGIPGIAESQIYFVSTRSGNKEIWSMDYDGANQKQVTKLGSIALSPRISPDGSRLAFSGLTRDSWTWGARWRFHGPQATIFLPHGRRMELKSLFHPPCTAGCQRYSSRTRMAQAHAG